MDFPIIVAIFGGGILYKLLQPTQYVTHQNLEGHHSRISNNPLPIDSHRQAGDDLFRSGHPTEAAFRAQNRKPKSLKEVQHTAANDMQKNLPLIAQDHYNNDVNKRKTYSYPSDDHGFPALNMASGWYGKAVMNRKQKNYYVKQS